MSAAPLELRGTTTGHTQVASLPGFERVGLRGALGGGHRARPTSVPGSLVSFGYRWRFADEWTGTWWPQGIAVGEFEGSPVALVSWYAQPRRGVEMGCRISVIDLGDPKRPTYRHVLLVSPAGTQVSPSLEPVLAHAGGIVWSGDRLLIAATFDGIREFRLSDILRSTTGRGMFGYDLVLPQVAHHRATERNAKDRMRYSFIGNETTSTNPGEPDLKLVAGEFHTGNARRVARLTHRPERTIVDETHVPGVAQMQGVARHDGTWFISASRGERQRGDLWSGSIGELHRHEGAVPPGPEDLAVWPERNELWSVSEPRGKRWVYAIDLGAVGPAPTPHPSIT